jgi:tripartite-type tricarboxylate transporter receptor subunit TctC
MIAKTLAAFLAASMLAGAVAAQSIPRTEATSARSPASYPVKPIRFIVPFPPGGGTDLVARLLSQKLSERFGQQVVVDNRGGANAIIGTELAAKAAPDGYTLVLALPASVAVNPSLYPNLPYDPLRDLAPVIQLNSIALLLVAHPSLAASSIKELIALARAKPGQITFGSSGTGGSSHLAMELFKLMAKVDMTHVPYKGGGPALNDLVGGQVQLYSGPAITSLPLVKAGRLKALGVTSAKRMQSLPDVPAIAETIPGYESDSWQGVLMPKGTPSAIVNLLNREIAKIIRSPDVVERLASQGAEPVAGSPAEFGAYIKAETAKYAKLIKAAGIKPD